MTVRVNATGEYLLPELGADAATEDGVIVSLLAARRRHLQSWSVELGIKRRNMMRNGYGCTCLVHVRRVVTIGFAPTFTWFGVGMDGELRCGSCFVLDTSMFGPCMERCDVGFCLADVWSVNGSYNVGCCFVFGTVQYLYCGWR